MAGEFPRKVVYISSDLAGTAELFSILERQSVKVLTAMDFGSALYHINNNICEAAIIQSEFSELRGTSIAQKIRQISSIERSSMGVILMVGRKELSKGEAALQSELGGIETIRYPFKAIQMLPYLQRALAYYKQELALAEMNRNLINYQKSTGDFDKAMEAIKTKLPELGARGPQMLLELYKSAEKWDEGLSLVNGLIDRNPKKDDLRLLSEKGSLLMKLGRFKEARDAMEKADSLAPDNIDRIEKMTDIYLEENEPELALAKMNQSLGLNPEKPEIKFDMMDRLFDKGFVKESTSLCKQTTLPEEIVKHYNNKGVLASKDGDQNMAMQAYEQALIFYPKYKDNYKIQFNMALAYINQKTPEGIEKARAALKEVLKLNPTFDKAKRILAQLDGKPLTSTSKAG